MNSKAFSFLGFRLAVKTYEAYLSNKQAEMCHDISYKSIIFSFKSKQNPICYIHYIENDTIASWVLQRTHLFTIKLI